MSGKQPLSPQGYNIKDRPVNANPFWDQVQGSGIGDVTASAETIPPTDPAEAAVTETDNPETGKTDLSFGFKIPAGPAGRPGEAGAPGRGIGVVAAETNTGSGVGVRVRETENVQNNEVDLTFQFDFPTEGSGSQSLDFVLLGAYLDGVQPPSNLVSRMREFPVVGFGVAYLDAPDIIPPPPPPPPEIQTRTSTSDYVPSHDIQTLIPTSELTSMPDIHLCKTFSTNYGCNAVLCVTVIPPSNGTRIFYDGSVKYMAGLTRIDIHGKTYYVNATTINPASHIHFGLCVWGVRLKERSA